MGGSFAAAQCAQAGLNTLVLEQGHDPKTIPDRRGILARAFGRRIDSSGERWNEPVTLHREENRKPREVSLGFGIGPGGSARVYGAALGRADRRDFEVDFQPDTWGQPGTHALPNDWPVDFDEFTAFYRDAEARLGLVGTQDPLNPNADVWLKPPPPISPAHQALFDRLKANGRHPFRMHVGIAYKPGCSECQGSTCYRDCKAHGFNRVLKPALEGNAPASLRAESTVKRLSRPSNRFWQVECVDHEGNETSIKTRFVILAAGALNSPRLLQNSPQLWNGKVPSLVGAGLMFHAIEMFAVKPPSQYEIFGPRKVIAFRDHYFENGAPMAECQSLGMVPKAGLINAFLNDWMRSKGANLGPAGRLVAAPIASFAERIFGGQEMFTAAIQDLPFEGNEVRTQAHADGDRISITYFARPEIKTRVKQFRKLIREAFDPLKVTFLSSPGVPNLGHPMGTCRMGKDPSHSVVDPDGQVRGQKGLYIADASVFPSSLGINPALTVAAHAIRVGQIIAKQTDGSIEKPAEQLEPG